MVDVSHWTLAQAECRTGRVSIGNYIYKRADRYESRRVALMQVTHFVYRCDVLPLGVSVVFAIVICKRGNRMR